MCSGSLRLRWVPGQTGARLLSTLSPSRSLPTWVSLLALRPHHSTGGSAEKSVLVFTVPFVTGSLPWFLTCMASFLTLSLTTSSLSGKTQCTTLTYLLLPFVFGVLPAGGHDHSSTGRPSRHGQGPAHSAMTRTAPSSFCLPFPPQRSYCLCSLLWHLLARCLCAAHPDRPAPDRTDPTTAALPGAALLRDHPPPGPSSAGPLRRTTQNFHPFFPLPQQFSFFLPSLGWWNFGGVLKRRDPKCTRLGSWAVV